MFLSIVIPIYNGADTIKRCLDSIWNQGLPENDFEVICVDDCSKDDTIFLLSEIAKEHPQLKVVKNRESLRAGGARNHGVREAQGRYIQFIDADDYFHPGSLKTAYLYQKEMASGGVDILVCDFARHTLQKVNDELVHRFPSTDIMTGRKFFVVNSLPYAPWKYMFRRELMIDNKIFFAEKVSCEDVDWSHKIAFYAKTMQYKPILLTHYILSESIQTGSEYKKATTVFHRLMAGKRLTDLVHLCNTDEEKSRIIAVAQQTLLNGVIFLCAVFSNPVKKADIVRDCIDNQLNWRKELRIIRRFPLMYGLASTAIAPLFRTAIYIRRKFFGR